MTFRETLAELGEANLPETVSTGWDTSMAEMPDDLAAYLDPKRLSEWREFAGLDAALDEPIRVLAAAIRENAALSRFFRHTCHRLCFAGEPRSFAEWPDLEQALGPKARLFYLIVALNTVPLTRKRHRKLRVSRQVTRDTCRDIAIKCDRGAILRPDLPGLEPRELGWLRRHLKGEIFTLGRFQYGLYPYRGGAEVFRNDAEDQVVALAPPEARFDEEGQRLAEEKPMPPGGWVSRLTVGEGDIRGNPISPEGFALPREATLPAGLWRRVLSTGDPILEIHIPAGGRMSPDRCLASLKEADRFFRRIFVGRLFRAFVCYSWFMGPQMKSLVPPTANILGFQRETYLFPVPSSPRDGLVFLFGTSDPMSRDVPRDTGLRRAVMEHLESGGHWGNGGMFFLPEDLPRYGRQPYRSRWRRFEKHLEDL